MITFSYENLQIVTFRRKVIIENFFVNLFFFYENVRTVE